MNRIILPVSLALAQFFAMNAMAQSKGEVDAAQAKPPPVAKATPDQKQAGKAMRKAEGAKEAKVMGSTDDKEVLGKAKVATKAQRKAAAKTRNAAAASALKKGEIPSGEK